MIGILEIKDWREVHAIAEDLIMWAFRGQSNKAWSLKTSIERLSEQNKVPTEYFRNREHWILKQFQRRAHLLINAPPEPEKSLEWLALIQHFGGPTRLLDFTHSFYVAAFFAMEQANTDAAIWAINLTKLEEINVPSEVKETVDQLNQRFIKMVEHAIEMDTPEPGVIHVEPDRLNERMSIQKGIFLFPKKITLPFMHNLAATFNSDFSSFTKEVLVKVKRGAIVGDVDSEKFPPIIKIILPKKTHFWAMNNLRGMNIDANTLFPGLEGFARSLIQYLRLPADAEQLIQPDRP